MDINWMILIPILVLQLTIQIIALVDLYKQKNIEKNKKIIWVFVILLFNILGPIVYFIFGRREKNNE